MAARKTGGLGRGLDALIPTKSENFKTTEKKVKAADSSSKKQKKQKSL